MYNLTKLKLLWDRVEDLTGRIVTDEKRLPPNYSTDEIATGVKWVDGKDIYRKIYTGTLPTFEGTTTQTVISTFTDNLIEGHSLLFASDYVYFDRFPIRQHISTNEIDLYNVQAGFSGVDFTVILYYTKPDPVPAEVTTKKSRKTKKEED